MKLVSPLLLVATIFVAFSFIIADAAPVFHWQYSTVTGYFLQDDLATDPKEFNYVCRTLSYRMWTQRLLTSVGGDWIWIKEPVIRYRRLV